MRNLCGSCKHRFKCKYALLGIKIVKCENYEKCDVSLDKWLVGGNVRADKRSNREALF